MLCHRSLCLLLEASASVLWNVHLVFQKKKLAVLSRQHSVLYPSPAAFTRDMCSERVFTSVICILVVFVLLVRADEDGAEEKRKIAQELISRADAHKEHSMRDVLRERVPPTKRKLKDGSRHSQGGAKKWEGHTDVVGEQIPHVKQHFKDDTSRKESRGIESQASREREHPKEKYVSSEPVLLRTWAEVFQWAINSTVVHAETASFLNSSRLTVSAKKKGTALPTTSGKQHPSLPAVGGHLKSERRLHVRGVERNTRNFDVSSFYASEYATEAEADIMFRALRVLHESPRSNVQGLVQSLLILEELCHGIDNGRDLHAAGGLKEVVRLMSAEHAEVRASAAWALGTCAQNNPTVQNASVTLGAVPVLVFLAADDVDVGVCSRALLALNALLELSPARDKFEELPQGIEALRRPLVELSDVRATRRALNLAELLVRRNLELWKTQLEVWEFGPVVERLMRSHNDFDVRESAARLINALDDSAF